MPLSVSKNIVLEKNGNEFPLEIYEEERFVEDSVKLKISSDGNKAIVGYLEEDWNPLSPMEYDGRLGSMIFFNEAGDKHDYKSPQDFLDSLEEVGEDVVLLPVYAYKHGGISFSTGPFSDSWDSGQIGYIYAPKQHFIQNTGFTENELFNKDKHRRPEVGEGVKIKNRDSNFGEVQKINKDGSIVVDFDYNKIPTAKKPENCIVVKPEDIKEVRANKAEEMLKNELKEYGHYIMNEGYFIQINEYKNIGSNEEPKWELIDEERVADVLGRDVAGEVLDSEFEFRAKNINSSPATFCPS